MIIPSHFDGIGYRQIKATIALEVISVPVPSPQANEVLIHVHGSSLNGLDHKLPLIDAFHRTPPVILGFDLAGRVAAVGAAVTNVRVGEDVIAMVESNKNGGWAAGSTGGWAVVRDCLVTQKPSRLSFDEAAALPLCFLSAYLSVQPHLRAGQTIYIPGGAGGVGHLAIQIAANVIGARVLSSGSKADTCELARSSGAADVFDYRKQNVVETLDRLTNGQGVDVVFDATYNEQSFIDGANAVRRGGKWIVLGVGPGRTNRVSETTSPVDGILKEKGAEHVNVNLVTYTANLASRDSEASTRMQDGLLALRAMVDAGQVKPHIGKVIRAVPSVLDAELTAMKQGRSAPGKTVVKLLD